MRRSLNMGLLTFLVMASTTACGVPGVSGITTLAKSVTPRTLTIPLPLDGISANQIATMSLKDLKNATSVRLSGTFDDSGRHGTMTITQVKGVGCAGTIGEHGQGTIKLILKGKTAWLKGDDTFWRAQGAGDGATMNLLADNYIKITNRTFINQFAPLCQFAAGTANAMGSKPTGLTDTRTIVNDMAAVELRDTSDSATMVVSDTATPEILGLNDPGSGGGSFTFSGFNQPATIAPPPTDQTLDGAQFGM
jgi:hypothetical protein